MPVQLSSNPLFIQPVFSDSTELFERNRQGRFVVDDMSINELNAADHSGYANWMNPIAMASAPIS
jgi:hypothetical protein